MMLACRGQGGKAQRTAHGQWFFVVSVSLPHHIASLAERSAKLLSELKRACSCSPVAALAEHGSSNPGHLFPPPAVPSSRSKGASQSTPTPSLATKVRLKDEHPPPAETTGGHHVPHESSSSASSPPKVAADKNYRKNKKHDPAVPVAAPRLNHMVVAATALPVAAASCGAKGKGKATQQQTARSVAVVTLHRQPFAAAAKRGEVLVNGLSADGEDFVVAPTKGSNKHSRSSLHHSDGTKNSP